MLEVEVKAKVIGPEQMERVLQLVAGSGSPTTEVQVDKYFAHPSRDFSLTDEALRVRRVGDRWVLTYKGPKIDAVSKTREEIECDVGRGIDRLLHRLGFREVATVRKRRRSYRMNGFTLAIDEVEGLGTFTEMESSPGDRATVDELLDVLSSLGLESETRSYLELLLEKGG